MGAAGAVEADSRFAGATPDDAYGGVGAGGDHEVIVRAFPFLEHAFIVAKLRGGDHVFERPFTPVDEFFFSGSDGKGCYEGLSGGIPDGGHFFAGIDDDVTSGEAIGFAVGFVFGDAFDFEGGDVGDFDGGADAVG